MAGSEALIALLAAVGAQSASDEQLRAVVERQAEQLERQSRVIEAMEARIRALEGGRPPATVAPVGVAASASPTRQATPPTSSTPTASAQASRVGRFPDDAVVRPGSFDRALTVPGTDLSLRLGGFVQADYTTDRGRGALGDAFTASAVVPEAARRTRSRVSARNSRLNLDVRGDSAIGPFRAFIEGDFAGTGGSEVVSNGSAFRLRHAFGQLGGLYAGQYWSAFVDVDAFPETLDPAGPAGKATVRQAGIRYVVHLDDRWTVAAAVENPEFDVRLPTGRTSAESLPDLHAYVGYARPWGHVKLAGVARRLAVHDGGSTLGWALNLTGRIGVPLLDQRDNVVFAAAGGRGAGRYLLELAGLGLDADVSTGGEVRAVGTWGGYLGAQHWWSGTVRSTVTAGLVDVEKSRSTSPRPARLWTQSANLLWNPIPPVTLGVELLNGSRENADGVTGTVQRLQLTSRYGF